MAIFCIVLLLMMQTRPGYAAWYQQADGWRYEHQGTVLRDRWIVDGSGKYYLDAAGQMLSGWQIIQGSRYFLNPVSDGTKGRCLAGWQWIDGYCYYFDPNGAMLSDTTTPDGYQVNTSGQWTEQGTAVYISGQGYLTKSNQTAAKGKTGGGRTSAGTGKGANPVSVPVEHPEIGGYESYDSQPAYESIYEQAADEASPAEASPAEAKQINWEIRFVDAETHSVSLAAARNGKIVQGGTLTVNFLSRIVKDGEIWEALAETPREIPVYGPGDGIYCIEYANTGSVPAGEEAYQTERDLLKDCLAAAREAEAEITGEPAGRIPEARFYITGQAANEQRLRTIAAHIDDSREHVFYVIGKNYEPNGTGLTAYFGDGAAYSGLSEAVIGIEKDVYYVIRFTIQRVYDPDTCAHAWIFAGEKEATCSGRGAEAWICEKCEKAVECCRNPPGHTDHDTVCDRCGGLYDEQENPHKIHWQAGDLQAREIDGKIYLFECIDENYSAQTENHRQAALFLCMSVIPSDTGSTYGYEEQPDGTYDYVFRPGPIVNFGNHNDYKQSDIRKWFEKNRSNFNGAEEINIGVEYAYMGSTASGRFRQLNDDQLQGHYIGNQKLTGNLFILSVDEALKYREYLWRLDGSDSDAAKLRPGAYSKAYWLRNPMGTAAGYSETKQVYVVDLVNGNIHPQTILPEDGGTADEEIKITSTTGVRPAFAVPQN